MNLVAENLMLIIDPVSDASSVANQLWLRHRLENGPDEQSGHEKSGLSPSGLTKSEHISMQAHASMANIILCVGGQERESESESASAVEAFNEDLYETLEKELTHISSMKTEALATKNTLHSLYTAYELGTTVLKFISYLSRTKQDVYNTKDEANIKTREVAERLLHAVIEKSTGIKRGLDESGWIDKVLESASRGEQAGTNQPKSVADTLKEMINENFLEEWAGHVLESWRDSVVGFSYFKVPKA
jgi:N-terminal acetyltransferase B complex non-catalytic subunit